MNKLDLKLNENSTKQECFKFCDNMWELNGKKFLKIIFFIRFEKKDKKLFHMCFLWLYFNHKESFFKNLSHILGIHNNETISNKTIKHIMKKDFEDFETYLNAFIDKNYQKPFIDSWLVDAKENFFKKYPIPVYGDMNDLIEISILVKNELKQDFKKTDIYNFIYNLLKIQISKNNIEQYWLENFTNLKIKNNANIAQIKKPDNKKFISLEEKFRFIS